MELIIVIIVIIVQQNLIYCGKCLTKSFAGIADIC